MLKESIQQLIDCSLADSTTHNYERALTSVAKAGFALHPLSDPMSLLSFFDELVSSGYFKSWNQVVNLRQAIMWWHQRRLLDDPPFKNKSVERYFTGLEKSLKAKAASNASSHKSEALNAQSILSSVASWCIGKGRLLVLAPFYEYEYLIFKSASTSTRVRVHDFKKASTRVRVRVLDFKKCEYEYASTSILQKKMRVRVRVCEYIYIIYDF